MSFDDEVQLTKHPQMSFYDEVQLPEHVNSVSAQNRTRILLGLLLWGLHYTRAVELVSQKGIKHDEAPLMLGRCFYGGFCAAHMSRQVAWSNSQPLEESHEVYVSERVGEFPEACFARGRHHWQVCRNTFYQSVVMTFQPLSGQPSRMEQFPPERVFRQALAAVSAPLVLRGGLPANETHSVEEEDVHAFIWEHLEDYDNDLAEYARDPWTYVRERSIVETKGESGEIEEHGGWKTVHMFVGKTGFDEDVINEWNGQKGQDKFVLEVLGYKRRGYFIELGAFDAIGGSNSLSLERNYGWRGLCIEPKEEHVWALAHRQCQLISAVVGEQTGAVVEFALRGWCGSGCAGIVGADTANTVRGNSFRHLPVVSFRKLLCDHKVPKHIDYLSLDVEGAEDKIIASFPFETHTIAVLSVEGPKPFAIATLLRNGYVPLASHQNDVFFVHPSIEDLEGVLARLGNEHGIRAQDYDAIL